LWKALSTVFCLLQVIAMSIPSKMPVNVGHLAIVVYSANSVLPQVKQCYFPCNLCTHDMIKWQLYQTAWSTYDVAMTMNSTFIDALFECHILDLDLDFW
jgi:hypothetical protein